MARILFIHPDHKLIGIYNRHLSPHFTIDSAHDGLAGLRMIKIIKPQLVVSDYQLPYLSGLSILKYVRDHPELYRTPFLFLTDSDMPHDALGMGASAWLKQSDVAPEELLHHIYQQYKTFSKIN